MLGKVWRGMVKVESDVECLLVLGSGGGKWGLHWGISSSTWWAYIAAQDSVNLLGIWPYGILFDGSSPLLKQS